MKPAMSEKKWIKLEDLRESAVHRVVDALREIDDDEQGLLEEAVIAAARMKRPAGDGGRVPQ